MASANDTVNNTFLVVPLEQLFVLDDNLFNKWKIFMKRSYWKYYLHIAKKHLQKPVLMSTRKLTMCQQKSL
jgi:hypothetical protein